jgi:hypothetical protein
VTTPANFSVTGQFDSEKKRGRKNMNNERELVNDEEISMSEILGKPLEELDPIVRAEMERIGAERDRLTNTKVEFHGVERRLIDFGNGWPREESGNNPELSWSGFTEEERKRGLELAQPFNDMFRRPESEISTSMYVECLTKSGFIFKVVDDFTDDCIEIVHEKDLENFMAEDQIKRFRPRTRK